MRGGGFAGADQERVESLDGLKQLFGAFVAVYYNCKRTLGHLPQQYGVDGFGSGGEAGKGEVAAGGQATEQILKGRMAAEVQEQVAYGGLDQGHFECIKAGGRVRRGGSI